jgi:hypothetical protein
MDWDDDDAPPDLIETAPAVEAEAEEKLVKVPITIVTGLSMSSRVDSMRRLC